MKNYLHFTPLVKTNTSNHSRFIVLSILIFFLNNYQATAQIVATTSGYTATDLAEAIAGTGIDISGALLTCHNSGRGMFECMDCNIGIDSGVVLTSGKAIFVEGANNTGSKGFITSFAGDTDLDALPGISTTQDACVLEFDLVPISDTITFEYVFGSEEYLEFVASTFNDVFAFFISGPGIIGTQNIALIPGTTTPVSINKVNNVLNSSYYNDNGTGTTLPYSGDDYYIQYDGFTDVFRAVSAVTPCETYHLKLAIGDVGDGSYDSGVFIKANSLNANLDFTVDGISFSSGDTVYVTAGVPVDLTAIAPAGYTYTWSPPTGLTTTSGSTTTATVFTLTTYTVTASDCGTFTGTITLIPDIILPVELDVFQAVCAEENVQISWVTLNESNLKEFLLNKSYDGDLFQTIATIPAAGFSNDVLHYSWVDENNFSQSAYYQLQQVDNGDVQATYSEKIYADCGIYSSFNFQFLSVLDQILNVKVSAPITGIYKIQLYDITGRMVFLQTMEFTKGLNAFEVHLHDYPTEQFYLITISNDLLSKLIATPLVSLN